MKYTWSWMSNLLPTACWDNTLLPSLSMFTYSAWGGERTIAPGPSPPRYIYYRHVLLLYWSKHCLSNLRMGFRSHHTLLMNKDLHNPNIHGQHNLQGLPILHHPSEQ